MKRLFLTTVTTTCLATFALLAGCSSSKPTSQNDSVFTYLLDKPSNWHENALGALPPLPTDDAKLYSFDVSNNTPLKFAIAPDSLSVGTDGVVRYTVVITSPVGARNVNYEGIRCDTFEWRLYASLNADHNGWDQTVANDWANIETGSLNAYHSVLFQDYFCFNKMPAGNARAILDSLRLRHIITPS